jgi:hypothetical protein
MNELAETLMLRASGKQIRPELTSAEGGDNNAVFGPGAAVLLPGLAQLFPGLKYSGTEFDVNSIAELFSGQQPDKDIEGLGEASKRSGFNRDTYGVLNNYFDKFTKQSVGTTVLSAAIILSTMTALSVALLATYPQTIPSVTIGTTNIKGMRVSSQTRNPNNVPNYPGSSTLYNDTVAITGNEELQISNGHYMSPGVSGAIYSYKNYTGLIYIEGSTNSANYTGISTSGYRFATFIWQLAINSSTYQNVTFNINDATSDLLGAGGLLYYRWEDQASKNPVNCDTGSSAWIDGINVNAGNTVTATNYFNPTTASGTLNYGGITLNTNMYKVKVPSQNITSQTVYLYCRIGLPMNSAYKFSSVSITI